MHINYKQQQFPIKTWTNEKLGSLIAFDTETDYTESYVVPELATVQAFDGHCCYLVPLNKLRLFLGMHLGHKLIMHNAEFDLPVLDKELGSSNITYEYLDNDGIYCTLIAHKLIHLGLVGFVPVKGNSLADLSKKHLNIDLDKNAEIRCNFMQFKNKKLEEIPAEFRDYMFMDVVATWHLWGHFAALMTPLDKKDTLLTLSTQVKGAYALKQIHVNGIGFNIGRRDEWIQKANKRLSELSEIMANYGYVKGMTGNSRRLLDALKFLSILDKLPLTKEGGISTASEHLTPFKEFQFIEAYLEFQELEKLTQFCRDINTDRIHPRYNVMVNTGRTSCSKPNFQQLPRAGGIREMFVPKAGHKFIITDYNALELAGLAEVNIVENGYSRMGDLINEGKDLHYFLGSEITGKSEKDVTKEERQFAKIGNFGFGANMAASTFVDYCKGYGLSTTELQAQRVKDAFINAYPEMRQFFNVGNETTVYTLSGRPRAECTYTAYLNTKFQGLCADGAKLALYEMVKNGFKIVGFVHDEIITEVPENLAQELQIKQEEIMISAMRKVIKQVRISVESQITDHYTK